MSWFEKFIDVCLENTSKKALYDLKKKEGLTYQELLERISGTREKLKKKGAGKGDRIASFSVNSIDQVVMLYAAASLGSTYVPLNYRLSSQERKEVLDFLEPKLLLVAGSEECEFHDSYELEEFVGNSDTPDSYDSWFHSEPPLMLFTSGTTGKPKGVLFSRQMLESNQHNTVESWGLLPSDVTLVNSPFFHTGGWNVLLLPLLSIGGTVYVGEKFDLDEFYNMTGDRLLSLYFGVPTMFHTISLDERFKSLESSGLRFLISGGAHCPSELIERFQNLGLTFKQGFGMTEVGPNCFLLEAKYSTSKMGSIGIPMPHSDVILLNDRDQQINQPNKIGELAIKGPHLCDGYFQNRQKFEESLIHGYFRTGDLAKFDEDGFYFIAGRKKDMFVSGGENIYPAEVERQIYSLNEVEDVVVVPVDDPKWGEVGFAFLKGEKKLPLQELREILNGRLSRYKHPHYVHYLEEMPLLANGKINRIQLKNLAQTLKEKEVRNDT